MQASYYFSSLFRLSMECDIDLKSCPYQDLASENDFELLNRSTPVSQRERFSPDKVVFCALVHPILALNLLLFAIYLECWKQTSSVSEWLSMWLESRPWTEFPKSSKWLARFLCLWADVPCLLCCLCSAAFLSALQVYCSAVLRGGKPSLHTAPETAVSLKLLNQSTFICKRKYRSYFGISKS